METWFKSAVGYFNLIRLWLFLGPSNHLANMRALWLTIHVGQQPQDGCPRLKLLRLRCVEKKRGDVLLTELQTMWITKDTNDGGNVHHYNNTKHMSRSAFDHKP